MLMTSTTQLAPETGRSHTEFNPRDPEWRMLVKKAFCLVTLSVLFCTVPGRADATIIWGSPTNISGDSDVLTTGALVGAFNLGTTGVAGMTVNGVTFAPFAVPNDDASGTTTVGNFAVHYDFRGASNTFYGSTSAPFSLSSSYQSLLRAGTNDNANSAITLTMSGLTTGDAYAFQWWCNYSSAQSFALTTATDTNSVSLDSNTTNLNGGVGQFAVGTFTAAGPQEVVTYDSVRLPFLSAFQLRTTAVPEPSSFVLAGLGLMGLGFAAGRKKSRRA
jgi:hypothetical protein